MVIFVWITDVWLQNQLDPFLVLISLGLFYSWQFGGVATSFPLTFATFFSLASPTFFLTVLSQVFFGCVLFSLMFLWVSRHPSLS